METILRQGMGYVPSDVWDSDMLEFEQDHKKYTLVVKEILTKYDKATNNDFILFIEYLNLMGLVQVTSSKEDIIIRIKKEKAAFIPNPESITRARRTNNHKGFGLPTNALVFERRAKRQKILNKYFGGEKWQKEKNENKPNLKQFQ